MTAQGSIESFQKLKFEGFKRSR